MKHIRLTLFVLGLSVPAMTLLGCAQPPTDEEKAAKDAVAAARNAEAAVYASSEWTDADQVFTTAETKMSDKEYSEAKKLFVQAGEKAKVATAAAERNKAQLASDLAQSKVAVLKTIDNVKTEFEKQHKRVAKGSAATIEAAIKEAESKLADASRLVASGTLMDAKTTLAVASSKADEATSALAAAVAVKQKPTAAKPALEKRKK